MSYTYRFTWPVDANSDIRSVHITGNFDNWSKTQNELKREGDKYSGEVTVPHREKLVFKFVLNEESWVVSPDYKIEKDSSGIENNVLHEEELQEVAQHESISESPASTTTSAPVAAAAAAAATVAAAAPAAVPEAKVPLETGKSKAATITEPPTPAVTKSPAAAKKDDATTASINVPPTKASEQSKPDSVPAKTTTSEGAPEDKSAVPVPITTKADVPAVTEPPAVPPPTTKVAGVAAVEAFPEPTSTQSLPHTTANAGAPATTPAPSKSVPILPSSKATEAAATEADVESITASPEPVDSVASPLTHVVTTSSSFAGVSLPSQDSVFEHLDETDHEIEVEEEEEDTNQFNTPTNSLFNSAVLNTPNTSKTESPSQTRKSHKDNVEILQAPGAFPSSPAVSHTNPTSSSPEKEKKDGLVSRFKSLFRY